MTTDSGGPRDFLTETDLLVPRTGEVLVPPRYRWGAEARLADYDVDALAAALQRARADTRQPERVSERFRVDSVAPQLRDWVEAVVAKTPKEEPPPRPLNDFAAWLEKGE